MKHLGTKQLDTARLTLRRITLEDAQAMFDNWASDPEVTKFLTWPPHSSVDVTKAVIGDWVAQYDDPTFYQWVIVPKELGQPIGTVAVVERKDEAELVHIGYCIGKAWWHRGYMSEALGELIRFFFEEVGVGRVECRHDPNNPHSGGVMRKCGMTYEGTTRRADRNNQGICDAAWYGILAEEWKENK